MSGYHGSYKGSFKRGSTGKDVAAVKRTLKRLQNNSSIKLSQQFNKAGEDALKRFQTNHKLAPDGVFGRKTFEKLAPQMRGYEVWLYKMAKARQSAIKTWAVLGPNADRFGVRTHQNVIDFWSKAAHIYGSPVIITTGTNHNQYVVGTHRESKHWTGNAGDVAMLGSNLGKLGRAALVAAGMPAWRAAFCRGGVYNVNGWNILFNTYIGGNHYNHCHAGD